MLYSEISLKGHSKNIVQDKSEVPKYSSTKNTIETSEKRTSAQKDSRLFHFIVPRVSSSERLHCNLQT